jgi:dihydrofolate reductase
MKLILIAAVAKNGVIGNRGALPWDIPEDMKHFKDTTRGHTVVMGRKTYESLGHPLPNRRNIVLSRSWQDAPVGACVYAEWEDAAKTIARDEAVYIIGGSEIYSHFLPFADSIILTEISASFDGDAVFPSFQKGVFSYDGYAKVSERPLENTSPPAVVAVYERR